ncbi:MAG: hypothetical protein FJX67_06180 [Alphaproteobacteria bacterium]|nr:hypothetical protein [Alphaproteobacteria bacterium]
MPEFWLALLVKMTATAAVVVTATYAAERSGPFWGGLITSLPVAAGPAYVLLSLQADRDFVAASALASFVTTPASIVFVVVFARLAASRPLAVSLVAAIAAWFAAALPIAAVAWTPLTGTLLNAVVFWASFRATRRLAAKEIAAAAVRARWYDLPFRAFLVGSMVAGVVTASDAIGPLATGMATVFPITFMSFVVILMPRLGGPFAAVTLAKAIRAMVGFVVALLALHLGTLALGTTEGLVLGLATSLAYSVVMVLARRLGRA